MSEFKHISPDELLAIRKRVRYAQLYNAGHNTLLLAAGPDRIAVESLKHADTSWQDLLKYNPVTRINAMVHIACRIIGVAYRQRKLQESYRVRQD